MGYMADGNGYRSCQPWAMFRNSELLSDITVLVEPSIIFRLHRFPLFVRSGYCREKFKLDRDLGYRAVLPLVGLPGGAAAFALVADFCYGVPLRLTIENVAHVFSAATFLDMTEDTSEGNLIQICYSFLNKEVFSDVQKCAQLLVEIGDDTLVLEKTCYITSFCKSQIAEHLKRLESLEASEQVLATGHLFETLLQLSCSKLEELLALFGNKGLTFITVGNFLASLDHQWLLSNKFDKDKGLPCSWSRAGFKYVNVEKDIIACVIKYLVKMLQVHAESDLVLQQGPSPSAAYLVTLLRCANDFQCDKSVSDALEHLISRNLEDCSLEDLQILPLSSVRSIAGRYSVAVDQGEDSLASPKMASVTQLLDSYLSWAVDQLDNPKFEDICAIAEALPEGVRSSCDALYHTVCVLFKKLPNLSHEERCRLCERIDYMKLSERLIEQAVQNKSIPLRPEIFIALYFTQKRALEAERLLASSLQLQLETMKRQIGDQDKAVEKLLSQKGLSAPNQVSDPVALKETTSFVCIFQPQALAAAADCTVWIGGERSLQQYEGEKRISSLEAFTRTVTALAVTRGGIVWAGCEDGKIWVYRLAKLHKSFQAHRNGVAALLASEDNQCWSGGYDQLIKRWPCPEVGESTYSKHAAEWKSKRLEGAVLCLASNKTGHLWSGQDNGQIRCWKGDVCVRMVKVNGGPVRAIVLDGSGDVWLGGDDGSIQCFNGNGACTKVLGRFADPVCSLALSRDGTLWAGYGDGMIRGWKEELCVAVLEKHKKGPVHLVAAKDGSLWSAGEDSKVIEWQDAQFQPQGCKLWHDPLEALEEKMPKFGRTPTFSDEFDFWIVGQS